MTPLLVFLGSLVADYSSSLWAISRGLREGNPVLAANPILIALVSAGIVIGLGEYYRRQKARGWPWIYWIGSGVHGLAATSNLVLTILKGAN